MRADFLEMLHFISKHIQMTRLPFIMYMFNLCCIYVPFGSYHQHVCVGMSKRAEVGYGVLNECSEDEAEADPQIYVNGLDEAVGIGQRRPRTHHQSGHGQHCGHTWPHITIIAHLIPWDKTNFVQFSWI